MRQVRSLPRNRPHGTVRLVAVVIGMICQKNGFGYTVLDMATMSAKEERLDVPASKVDRAEQLDWLLSEAERMFRTESATNVWVQKSGIGQHKADPQRHEVEAIVQVAAYRANTQLSLQTTESVRGALGATRAAGAYKELLKRSDIAERTNAQKREQYAYALAAAT
jgi:hypothetical protein